MTTYGGSCQDDQFLPLPGGSLSKRQILKLGDAVRFLHFRYLQSWQTSSHYTSITMEKTLRFFFL